MSARPKGPGGTGTGGDQPRLILASQSPRRQQLLAELKIAATVAVSTVDEEAVIASEKLSGHDPEALVGVLAERKAQDVAANTRGSRALVLGADTVVVHGADVLGKPTDEGDARRMLTAVRGQWIDVVSGVSIIETDTGICRHRTVTTPCRVAAFDDATLDRYLAGDVWTDKAGALAVQHHDPQLIETVDGCWTNVVGLPLCTVAELLDEGGLVVDPAPSCLGPAENGSCALSSGRSE